MPQLKGILAGFDKLLFPAVPKSMIGSVSDLLKELGHREFETKCYTYVLRDETKLVGGQCIPFLTFAIINISLRLRKRAWKQKLGHLQKTT